VTLVHRAPPTDGIDPGMRMCACESNNSPLVVVPRALSSTLQWSLEYSIVFCEGCIFVVSAHVAAACHGQSNLALVGPSPVAVSDGPGDYADDMECAWNITSVGPITIVFKAFSTEANRDFLRIFDGESGDVIGSFSGETLPALLSTNATSLRIMFTSDGGVASGGFELEAFALVPGGTWAPTGTPTTGSPTGAPTALPTWAPDSIGALWSRVPC
jgi:hypothetical protein